MLTKSWTLGDVTFSPNDDRISYNGRQCTSISIYTRIDDHTFRGASLFCSVSATRADVEAEHARITRPDDEERG